MAIKNKKTWRRKRIHMRIRKAIKGTATKPRLNVFRSNKEIYAQLIDDLSGHTLAASSSKEKTIAGSKDPKMDVAKKVGENLAKKAKGLGIETCLFDRGGYLYHGRVKALAEGAREGGLKF